MELLSVIIPVYNCERYIEECLESILAQTYPQIEIIVVDDGSSDDGGGICDRYAKMYQNIKVIHQINMGISRARLTGVKYAKGERIAFIDADDWIQKDFYKDMMENMGDCDLVISGIKRYTNQERCIEEKVYYKEGMYDKEQISEQIIPCMMWNPDLNVWGLDPSLCTKIFTKEMIFKELEKVKEIESDYGEDSMVIYPLIFHVNKMRVIRQAYYYHRQKPVGTVPAYIQDELFFDKFYSVYTYLNKEFSRAGYLPIMRKQLEYFYFHSVELKVKGYNELDYRFFCMFPFLNVERNSRVILYGAGLIGRTYMEQNDKYHFCDVILWVDRDYKNIQYKRKIITDPQIIKETEFDYIIIAVNDYYTALQIVEYISGLGISKDKIIWQNVRRCANKFLD